MMGKKFIAPKIFSDPSSPPFPNNLLPPKELSLCSFMGLFPKYITVYYWMDTWKRWIKDGLRKANIFVIESLDCPLFV